jgi:hypothetical protein
MNAPDPLSSLSNFLLSTYGLVSLLFLLALIAFLWSDQIKRWWYDRMERKKWEQWNGPIKKRQPSREPDDPTDED